VENPGAEFSTKNRVASFWGKALKIPMFQLRAAAELLLSTETLGLDFVRTLRPAKSSFSTSLKPDPNLEPF
jgi:hypothetical protein